MTTPTPDEIAQPVPAYGWQRAEEVDHIVERRGTPLGEWSCLHHQENLRALCHGCHVTRYEWDGTRSTPPAEGHPPTQDGAQ